MKRDPHAVYEACRDVLRRTQSPCRFCPSPLRGDSWDPLAVKLQRHDINCPLRIVIEAALENTEATESEGE